MLIVLFGKTYLNLISYCKSGTQLSQVEADVAKASAKMAVSENQTNFAALTQATQRVSFYSVDLII